MKPQPILIPKITLPCDYYHANFKPSDPSLSPSSLDRGFISVPLPKEKLMDFDGTAWIFRLEFWHCQQHLLRKILISSNLRSEVFVA